MPILPSIAIIYIIIANHIQQNRVRGLAWSRLVALGAIDPGSNRGLEWLTASPGKMKAEARTSREAIRPASTSSEFDVIKSNAFIDSLKIRADSLSFSFRF